MKNLAFYENQQSDMYAINLKYLAEMQSIAAAGKSFSTMMKLRDMDGNKDKEVKKVLDKGQYKTYKKLKKEMQGQMKRTNASSKRSEWLIGF